MNDEKIDPPKNKFILDPCCGPRMMWVNKNHPNVIYGDIRQEPAGFIPNRPNRKVEPDVILDVRKLPYKDKSFKLVVFDPPHLLKTGKNGLLGKNYGILNAETWQDLIKRGWKECWRVLDDFGVLVMKWNDYDIAYEKVMSLIPEEPLFRNVFLKSKSRTFWVIWMKIPAEIKTEKEASGDE